MLSYDKYDKIKRAHFFELPGRLTRQKVSKDTNRELPKEGDRFYILEDMPED
jgi:hypothetical protein